MRPAHLLTAVLLCLALIACGDDAEPTPTPTATATGIATATALATPTATAAPTPTPSPTPAPLSLEPAAEASELAVEFTVAPDVPAEGTGTLLVTVTNLSDENISEIVLRWPTALRDQVHLAPFSPSAERIASTLVGPWTKWVEGPGMRGEPAGTTSLGYGPVLAGGSIEIPIVAERRAEGAIEFDLQLLDKERILQTAEGEPAQTRVQIPAP